MKYLGRGCPKSPLPWRPQARPCTLMIFVTYIHTKLFIFQLSLPFLLLLIMWHVCLCFEIRFKKNHGWLPGHGRSRPAVRLHCGHGQFLLGGKPDPARGWPSFPHDRYAEPLKCVSQQKWRLLCTQLALLCYLSIYFVFMCEKSTYKVIRLWWVIKNLKKEQCQKCIPEFFTVAC